MTELLLTVWHYSVQQVACSMIGYSNWHHTVFSPSVCDRDAVHCGTVALRVGVGVDICHSCAMVFLGGHFLFTSSDTFVVSFSHNTQRNFGGTAEISASWIAMVTWQWLFQTQHFQRFCSAEYNIVRLTQYDRSSWQQLRFWLTSLYMTWPPSSCYWLKSRHMANRQTDRRIIQSIMWPPIGEGPHNDDRLWYKTESNVLRRYKSISLRERIRRLDIKGHA